MAKKKYEEEEEQRAEQQAEAPAPAVAPKAPKGLSPHPGFGEKPKGLVG